VLLLTEDGRAVMRAERPARLRLPSVPVAAAPRRASTPPGVRGPATTGSAESGSGPAARGDEARGARDLFEALRQHRLALAREEGLPPYVIASDRTLRELAELRPRTLDELRVVHGIGPHKLERYGLGLLAVVARPADAGA
jgi:ATP-dependent DNA helicase RecQ